MWSNGPGGQLDLWKMKPDGTAKTRVTTTQDLNTEAAWGSDGTIAFARRAKGGSRFEIWTMPAAGGAMTRIIVSNVRNDTQPSWLQDGKLVFATDRDEDHDYDLFRATKVGTSWSHESASRTRPATTAARTADPPRRTTIAAWRSQPPTGSTTRRTTTRTS